MADQNTPINGNYNSNNSVSVSGLIDAINHLDATQAEVINALKSVANNKNIGVNSNDLKKAIKEAIKEGNKDTNSKSFKSYDYDTKKLDKYTLTYIKDMDKASDAFGNIKQTVNKLNRELDKQERSLGKVKFDSEFTEFRKHLTNLNNAIDASNKQSVKIDSEYRKKLADNVIKINSIRDSIIKQNNYYERTTSEEARKNILAKKAKLQQDLALAQEEHSLIKDEYDEKQNAIRRQAKLKNDELEELESLLSQRSRIEEKNNKLLSSSQSSFHDSLSKLKDTLKPKQSEEYLTQMAEADDDAKLIQSQIEQNEQETRDTEELIAKEDVAFTEFTEAVLKYEKLLEENKDTATEEQKDFWLKSKNDAMISRKKSADSRAELIAHKESLNQQKKVLEGSKTANEKFKENLIKQTNIFAKLGDKLASTITKAFTSVVEHQLQMLVDSANSAFDAIESTQKTLGKTLKMNSGEYSEFVDMIQEAAKDAGTAISSSQALELATTVAEMGVRDENLIKTLAIEQAKIQEAGLTGIVQLNEETIKQYQQEYLKDIQKVGQDQAEENLKKRLDNVIAIEYAVSEEFKSATALANGGFAEIQNYANEMEKAGYITAENRAEFEYTLARFAQNIENQGGNFSEVLTQFSSLLTNTESDLGAQMLTFLSGNTDKTGNDMVEATTEMLNRYLQQTQSIYGGLNATSLKYVKQAYNDDRTATNIKTLTETGALEAKTLEDLEISTNKLNSAISDGDYLSATEKMQKKQLDYVEEIAQKMQKIPDGKYYMDAGLNTAKDLLTGLSGFLGSFLGNMFGSSLGGFGTNMSGSMSNTTSTGGLGAFLTGNKATKAGVVGSEITGVAGILYGEAILAKNAYEGYQEGGLKGGLVGLAEGTGDKEFARGMGMALGGALGGPVGAAIGGTLSAELVPKAQQSFEKLITSGIADPAADAYKEMKEAGMLVKESAQKLTDSANLQLQNLETEKKESANWNAYTKEEWLRQHAEELDIDSKTIANLDSEEAVNTAFKEAYEKYFNMEQAKAESELDIAELADKFGVTAAETLSRYGDDIFVDKGTGTANILKSHLAEQGMSITDWESAVNTYMEANKMYTDESGKKHAMTQEYAEKQILSNMGITEEEQQSNFLKTMEDWSQFHEGWISNNNQFQTKWKSAQEYASNPNDYKSVLTSYNNLYHKNQPDFVPELETNSSGQFIDEYGNVTEIPSLSTQNHKYYPVPEYKIGLDYVPYDNYLALLHRGETVLNANEAQEYRTDNNNINFDTITNTLVSQTDRIETILKQIYTAILTISRGSNRTTLNPNIVNMVSGIATL